MKSGFHIRSGVLFAIVLLALFTGCSGNKTPAKEKQDAALGYTDYNVILIAFDGMQAKHLHEYGYALDTTPNLDKFLDKSYLFTNAVSPASWTVPTFMSIFTSMYPSEHKLTNKFSGFDNATGQYIKSNLKDLAPDAVTLAEIFKQNGYKTAGFTGDAGITGSFGYSQGFDEYYDGTMFGGFGTSMPKAVDWLKKNKDQKFFLFVHGYDVHGQYAPAGGFDYRYVKTRYLGNYTGSPAEQGMLREQGLAGTLNLSDEDVRFWRAVYDEKINRADYQFKLFMDQAEEMGLLNNTIFVVFSDHGTEFYEHQKFDHGHTLYGELVDVLFSIHLPNQARGVRVDSLVSTLDIMPTVLKLVGIENPVSKQTRGIDLTPSFTGEDISRSIYSETDYRLYTHKRSIRTPGGWKLIVTYPGEGKELYNLKADPKELVNLVDTETAKTAELAGIIDQHLADMDATGPWTLGCVPVYNDQCKSPAPAAVAASAPAAAEKKK